MAEYDKAGGVCGESPDGVGCGVPGTYVSEVLFGYGEEEFADGAVSGLVQYVFPPLVAWLLSCER